MIKRYLLEYTMFYKCKKNLFFVTLKFINTEHLISLKLVDFAWAAKMKIHSTFEVDENVS